MYPKSKKTDSGPSDDDGDEGGGVDDDEESEEEVEHHHHHPWWSTMHARPSHPSPARISVHSFHNLYILYLINQRPKHHVQRDIMKEFLFSLHLERLSNTPRAS